MARYGNELGRDHAAAWPTPSTQEDPVEPRAPNVLLEVADGAEAQELWRQLRRRGLDVHWCPGPSDTEARSCPLVTDGRCEMAEGADVIVCSLTPSGESRRRVAEAHEETHPEVPVVLEARSVEARQWASLHGHRSVSHLSAQVVVDALDDLDDLDVSPSARRSG